MQVAALAERGVPAGPVAFALAAASAVAERLGVGEVRLDAPGVHVPVLRRQPPLSATSEWLSKRPVGKAVTVFS